MRALMQSLPFPALQDRLDQYPINELKGKGIVSVPLIERKYEKGLLRADGKPRVDTPAGRCEIWSTKLDDFGYSPLPYYEDKYPGKDILKSLPLILTGGRKLEIYHGPGLTLPSRRKRVQDPVIELHPETAENLGVKEGDWVWIETHHNKNRFKRKFVFSPHLHPSVIWENTHFHYPEKKELMERLEPNINLSHTLDGPLDPIDGAGQTRGVPCRIAKA